MQGKRYTCSGRGTRVTPVEHYMSSPLINLVPTVLVKHQHCMDMQITKTAMYMCETIMQNCTCGREIDVKYTLLHTDKAYQ